jgi:hypothetical protein
MKTIVAGEQVASYVRRAITSASPQPLGIFGKPDQSRINVRLASSSLAC